MLDNLKLINHIYLLIKGSGSDCTLIGLKDFPHCHDGRNTILLLVVLVTCEHDFSSPFLHKSSLAFTELLKLENKLKISSV